MNDAPVLAIDLGGTKIMVALVRDGNVLDRHVFATPREGGAAAWCDAIAEAAARWQGQYAHAGAAVTGGIRHGRWFALNPETLPVPQGFDLAGTLEHRLGMPVHCANDAQAAAWGEYKRGAGQGRDMAFITISTGIGGGLVLGGQLIEGVSGLAGHIGLIPTPSEGGETAVENLTSGRWIARAAAGRGEDARAVFAAAEAGQDWAVEIVSASLERAGQIIRSLQWIIDPEIIVIGGGIGMSPLYFKGLASRLEKRHATTLLPAMLGAEAGIVGAAELALVSQFRKDRS